MVFEKYLDGLNEKNTCDLNTYTIVSSSYLVMGNPLVLYDSY